MKEFRLLLATAAVFGMAATAAQAQQTAMNGSAAQSAAIQATTSPNGGDAYSGGRMVGRLTGDATQAQYSPDYRGNIVGGGDRVTQRLTGDATEAQYANPYTRRGPGIPTFANGRKGEIIYLPERN